MTELAGFELTQAPSNLQYLGSLLININILRDNLRNQRFSMDSYKHTISTRVQGKLKETFARQKE